MVGFMKVNFQMGNGMDMLDTFGLMAAITLVWYKMWRDMDEVNMYTKMEALRRGCSIKESSWGLRRLPVGLNRSQKPNQVRVKKTRIPLDSMRRKWNKTYKTCYLTDPLISR